VKAVARVILWWAGVPAFWRWTVVVAEIALLWWLSSREGSGVSLSLAKSFVHNSAHVVAYGLLAALVLLALRGRSPWRWIDVGIAVAIAGCYGVVDELHQSFVPGRVCSVADIVADLAGAVLVGALLMGLAGGRPGMRSAVIVAGVAALLAVTVATFLPW